VPVSAPDRSEALTHRSAQRAGRPICEGALVSVVIPAYNAAATLDETLHSVRTQTHRALEIIVVDDGSTDTTRALAERHAAADGRLRVLHQANAGVAAARNTGWQHARSDLIAFVDADDLWAPTKIDKQLRALLAGGERCGLAYCWMSRIDAAGAVIRDHGGTRHEGRVLDAILQTNFVGNGSAALVRRQALIDSGGFDSRLRAAGGEGCEDWLFYARVAGAYDFALVAEHLVGYRELPDNMSSNRQRMLRSHMLMCDQMRAQHPRQAQIVRLGLRNYAFWLLLDTRPRANLGASAAMWSVLLRGYPRVALRILLADLPLNSMQRLRNRLGRWRRGIAAPVAKGAGRRFLPRSADGGDPA
jgi:glycosyltransferase involved in cell wall biosynthesis